jgi:hypothetical protein
LPAAAIVGLESQAEPLQDAIAAAGADTIDLSAVPLLCVPLWALSPVDYDTIAGKLPLLP